MVVEKIQTLYVLVSLVRLVVHSFRKCEEEGFF